MKKLIIFFAIVTMVTLPIYGFAQTRNASGLNIGYSETRFENVAAAGKDVTGNPGYIALTGVAIADSSYVPIWYIWVDAEGDLVMASGPTVENCSEFPDGNFSNECIINQDTKVGGQS